VPGKDLGLNRSRVQPDALEPPVIASTQIRQKGPARRGWRNISSAVWWGLLGSLALAAVYGRVALLNLNTGVVGGDLDGYENLWNNYWVKTALLDLHRNPFYTDYIYYPTGISLRFHTLNLFNGLLTMPFNLTLGWVATTNLLFVLSLAFTTFFAFLLIRDIAGYGWAAFAGAALFTYANEQVLGFFWFGQAEKLSAQWYPLYLFFMFRTLHGPPNQPQKGVMGWRLYLALSVLTLVILSLTDWQYLIYAVFTTLLYFGFVLCTRRSRREKSQIFFKLAAIGGLYAAIVAIPLIIPMLKEAAESPWLSVSDQSVYHSRDLLDFISLGLGNPGYLALLIGLFGLIIGWRQGGAGREKALFWTLAATIASILALGPWLQVGGQGTDGRGTNIPLPFQLLYKLPVLSTGRDPQRFYTIAMLGFGILTAFGLKALFEKLTDLGLLQKLTRRKGWLSAILTLVFLTITLAGFVIEAGKAKAYPPDWPPFYEQLGRDSQTYAILELPLFSDLLNQGRGEDTYEAFQAIHHKPRFSGRLARDHKLTNPNNFVKRASLFRDLWLLPNPERQSFFYPERDFLSRTDYKTQGVPVLNYYDVRYIILYKEAITPPQWSRYQAMLKEVLGQDFTIYYEDRIMQVYKVPLALAPANLLTLDVGNGWSSNQRDSGQVYRWADNKDNQPSELYTMNLSKEPVRASLSLKAFVYKQPRTLKIMINGYEAATYQLKPEDGEKLISLELTLPPGNNLLTFTTPEPPLPTDDPAKDARLLSFGAKEINLTPKPLP